MVKRIFSQKGLRIICICLAVISLGALTTKIIASSISSANKYRQSELRKKTFESVIESLEFSGLNDSTKEKISELANAYGEYSNIIITDDAGNVIYSFNEGYMPDKDIFTVIVNTTSNIGSYTYGFIIDTDKDIKYQMRFDRAYNYSRLHDLTKASGLAEELFIDDEGNKTNVYSSHLLSTKYMNYAYIGSKGWNVYTIFDRTDSYYYSYTPGRIEFVDVMARFGVIAFVLFWLLLPMWVFVDARSVGFQPALWGLLVIITNIIGLIVYLVVKPDPILCRNCKHILASKYVMCPFCGSQNKELCKKCKNILEDAWSICPYCGETRVIEVDDEKAEASQTDANTVI